MYFAQNHVPPRPITETIRKGKWKAYANAENKSLRLTHIAKSVFKIK